ncbi:MAG TPA: alginate export family protein [Micropepsaceae bacterium]|nr:alginate export family protein [Micropepsaceae bacterium]
MNTMNVMTSRFLQSCAFAALAGLAGLAAPVLAEEGEGEKWVFSGDARLRYENVDQDGFADEAQALTLRVRAGVTTPTWHGFQFLVEGEAIAALSTEYNSTANGKVWLPIVADGETIELNRAQITYKGIEGTTLTLGRQRITLGNQRFIGNVGWRQNEQTFDAFRVDTKFTGVTLTYAYVDTVQRVFGNESPNGEFESDSHLVYADIAAGDFGNITPYLYALDLEEAPTQSTLTFGARWSGSWGLDDETKLTLAADLARQSDYGGNPLSVDLGYGAFDAEIKNGPYAFFAGVEWLDGDGLIGFSTPLATLFKFNGWADAFLNTPTIGLTDFYAGATANFADIGEGLDLSLTLKIHDFSDADRDISFGSEVDLLAALKWDCGMALEARYASYDRDDAGPASRDKVWLSLSYAF